MEDAPKIIATLANLFNIEGMTSEFEVLSQGKCSIENSGYDNWNGGSDIYEIVCKVPIKIYSKYNIKIKTIEENIKNKAEEIFKGYQNSFIDKVLISPELSSEIQGKSYIISTTELHTLLEQQKSMMISVSTGGPQVKNVNAEYIERNEKIITGLKERNIQYPNQHNDLWAWRGKWSDGSLPQYQQRRIYISDIFSPLLAAVQNTEKKGINPIFDQPTGWARVDRSAGEIRTRLAQSSTEEQFQAIGLLCRETLISLAQMVFIAEEHQTLDRVHASTTDAKRMLEAYIAHTLSGSKNESTRKYARASLDLANDLTHSRTANFRLAALCAESTNAVINIIAIISGRRDPN